MNMSLHLPPFFSNVTQASAGYITPMDMSLHLPPFFSNATQLFSGHPLPSPVNFKGEDGPLVQKVSIALLWSDGFRTKVRAQLRGSRNVTLSWTSTLKLPLIC